MKIDKGFTLLEVLVSIAIISILASITFAMLGSSRDKGYDAMVEGNLLNAQLQAEAYFEKHGNFSGICEEATEDGIYEFYANLDWYPGAINNNAMCDSDDEKWMMQAPLRGENYFDNDDLTSFCVDNTRNRMYHQNALGSLLNKECEE